MKMKLLCKYKPSIFVDNVKREQENTRRKDKSQFLNAGTALNFST